jgi:hypothetical protein
MSLINDALKRATASEPKKDAAGNPTPPLEPVHDGERRSSPGVLPLVLCIVGLGALFAAGGFWLKSKGTPHPATTSGTEGANAGALTLPPAGTTEPLATTPAATPTPLNNPVSRATATLEQVQKRNEEVPATQAATPASSSATSSSPAQTPPVQQVSTPAAAPAPTPTETAAEETNPPFKLQAIYYRLRGPSVVINGKTVKTGQSVDGAKVVSIQRTSVELEFHGTNFSLTLP